MSSNLGNEKWSEIGGEKLGRGNDNNVSVFTSQFTVSELFLSPILSLVSLSSQSTASFNNQSGLHIFGPHVAALFVQLLAQLNSAILSPFLSYRSFSLTSSFSLTQSILSFSLSMFSISLFAALWYSAAVTLCLSYHIPAFVALLPC